MKVLVICSGNKGISPFILEQIKSLQDIGLVIDVFAIKGNGILGYLKNYLPLLEKISNNDYSIVHAHYGLSGLLANLQRKVPVITTFHGSDIHYIWIRIISKFSALLSAYCILTNKRQFGQLGLRKNAEVVPCGIDTELFIPMSQELCRSKHKLRQDAKIVLFGSSYNRLVKNAALAIDAISELDDVDMIELKGYERNEVVELINAADVVLVTSFHETGPLIIKEALACNKPVISTDVGDVRNILGVQHKSAIVRYDAKIIANKISRYFSGEHATINYRELVLEYDQKIVAQKIHNIYKEVYVNANCYRVP